MKKKKILMLVCMAVLAVTVVIPVNAAKKTNKKQIQVLNLYQDQKTDIEEAEYLVSYLEDKNIDEESVEKQEKEEWYIDIKTGKITKDSQYKRHFYNDGWTIEFKDDKGKILYSTEDEEDEGGYRVLHEFNKDKFLVVERLESIDERSIYLGFMNAKGKWKQDPWKVDNDLLGSGYKGDELFQLGKGIVGFCIKNTGTSTLLVFDSNTDKVFSISNVWPKNLYYCGGKMVYQIWEASRTYEICVADSEGNVTKLHEEGVDLLDSNENGFLTDENGISFYDLSGNLQWSFNKYDVSSAWLYGKNVFVKLNGNDGNTYISNINQKTGELVYEPIRIFNDSPYLYVGSVNGEAYKYINNPTELVFQNSLFPPNETICYVIENGRILLYKPDNKNTLIDDRRSINEIMIKAVWENPEEILTMFEDNDGQDIELPFPSDMIETAIFELLKVEFNIISRDNDIKLKEDVTYKQNAN